MYAKIRSWHRILRWSAPLMATYRLRCGKTAVTGDVRDELPLDEKSCETCLRLTASDAEVGRNDAVTE